jgi:hypothetical protein
MSWSVSQVMQTGGRLGYGFSVVAPHCEPFLTLAFKTAAEAERARAIIEAELATVQLLVTGPNSSRSTVVNDNRKAGVPTLRARRDDGTGPLVNQRPDGSVVIEQPDGTRRWLARAVYRKN